MTVRKTMKRFVKSTVPNPIRSFISINRKYRSNKQKHESLNNIGEEISPDLMQKTKVIPDRGTLLGLMPKNGLVAEIGVAEGLFATKILHKNSPKVLHLIDSWCGQRQNDLRARVERSFADQINRGNVKLHQGLSWDIIAEFPDSYFDWVYIDADHSYESVKKDLDICSMKVKHNGYICGHDYITWSSGITRFGVVEAVNEFINKTESQLVYITNQRNRHLSYAMQLNKKYHI
jgi:hypothetical protein